jgi:hypothetical protein
VNLYRKARKNAGGRRVAIILSVTGGNRIIDEMAHLVFALVMKCLKLRGWERLQTDSACVNEAEGLFESSKGGQ